MPIKLNPLKCAISNCTNFSIFSKLCDHYHYVILEHYHTPKSNDVPIVSHLPWFSSVLQQPLTQFRFLWMFLFWIVHVSGSFSDWLPMFLRFIMSARASSASLLSVPMNACGVTSRVCSAFHSGWVFGLLPQECLCEADVLAQLQCAPQPSCAIWRHFSKQLGGRGRVITAQAVSLGERWGLAKSEPSISVVMANNECVDLLMLSFMAAIS